MARRVSGQRNGGSEAWLLEWFEWGYKCLCEFLANQAAFDAWCETHHREEII
jgi:hypothetical protein